MRLLIFPFDDELVPIEDEIFELESQSKEEITSSFHQLIKDRPYQIEIYKNINEYLTVHIGNIATGAILFYDKTRYSERFNQYPFETGIELLTSFVENDGAKQVLQRLQIQKRM